MTSQNPNIIAIRSLWPLLAVAVLVALAAAGGEGARLALRYDRPGIETGQLWRLITGHFVHLGWSHTLLNLAGLGLVAALFPREFRPAEWFVILACSLVAISAAFLIWRPELSWYVGLSGILHGLFIAGAVRWLLRREFEGYLLAAFLFAKLVWEQFYGALPLSVSSAGGPVVVDAHLAGAVGGALGVVAVLLRDGGGQRR